MIVQLSYMGRPYNPTDKLKHLFDIQPTTGTMKPLHRLIALLLSIGAFLIHPEDSLHSAKAEEVQCSAAKKTQILAKATPSDRSVIIDCSITLTARDTVTKQLLFIGNPASGARFHCNGAKIDNTKSKRPVVLIKSKAIKNNDRIRWEPPRDIQITGCNIKGSIRISGMAINGEDPHLKASSVRNGHTARAKANAPKDILLDNLDITSTGNIPLYVSPGVEGVHLRNSKVGGKSGSVAIYFDAESGHNTVENNTISVVGAREQIAVDGSAHNKIIGNRFNALARGGIYLYRNCGEGGTIRHQSPQHNLIEGNTFLYIKSNGYRFGFTEVFSNQSFKVPAVWLGSRHGKRLFCGSDKGYNFGSSASDRDFAQYNKVINNDFIRLSPKRMIENDDKHNVISGNKRIKP